MRSVHRAWSWCVVPWCLGTDDIRDPWSVLHEYRGYIEWLSYLYIYNPILQLGIYNSHLQGLYICNLFIMYKAQVLFLKMFFMSHLGMTKALLVQAPMVSSPPRGSHPLLVYVIRVIDYRLLQIFTPLKTNECPPKRDYFSKEYIWTNHWFSGDTLVFGGVQWFVWHQS